MYLYKISFVAKYLKILSWTTLYQHIAWVIKSTAHLWKYIYIFYNIPMSQHVHKNYQAWNFAHFHLTNNKTLILYFICWISCNFFIFSWLLLGYVILKLSNRIYQRYIILIFSPPGKTNLSAEPNTFFIDSVFFMNVSLIEISFVFLYFLFCLP